ncbi:DUF3558 domain-containing protein [Rhodococcus rhodochrous]|uniref:DUF3558 domain-containing protein n=1 Tax=Rhodococcus rhodochrous KG-21 TaxID=1441923 RepID=A0A0M8PP27_RHORH|nr:DUF3558 domain-containing protein [Rhodococcus rhodochrous]KOS56149.1 hypothetical protein Z051_11090 [Rhodococcus rhodochrous KG-21]
MTAFRSAAAAGALLALASLTGCADPTATTDTASETPSTPTTTTRMPRLVDESDRPLVAFDPCLDIPDDVLISAGYDPKSENSADFAATHYTMLGCSYDGAVKRPGVADYGLTVRSANFDLATELQKIADNGDNVVPTEIAGRRALLKTNTSYPESCHMSVETSYGVMLFGQVVFGSEVEYLPESQWCIGIQDTAERIVAVLDDFESRTR